MDPKMEPKMVPKRYPGPKRDPKETTESPQKVQCLNYGCFGIPCLKFMFKGSVKKLYYAVWGFCTGIIYRIDIYHLNIILKYFSILL